MSKKINMDFTAVQTAEEFFNYVNSKVKGEKLTGINKYELKQIMNDASRQCDANLVAYIRDFIENN